MTQQAPANDTTERRPYVSCTDAAAQIRASLKKLGISSRKVSVRSDMYSLGSEIHVLVKSPDVQLSKVKEIAERFERIDRCHASGEILSGGNRFVEIAYASPVVEALARPIAALIPTDGTVAEVAGFEVYRTTGYSEGPSPKGDYYRAERRDDEDDLGLYCWGREFCARQIAARLLDAGLGAWLLEGATS